MKKIGILFGKEDTFPQAFINRVNEKNVDGIVAEAVSIDKVVMGETTEYAVIIDRISQDVPFYRAYLKNAALSGTAVINNPFWWSADEKFFNNALAIKVGVPVPKTVLLPSNEMPDDTDANSFRNLKYPLDWNAMFDYIGFPAYMKPFSGGGWKSVYKVSDAQDMFNKHNETGQLVMMLQEEIDFTHYFRCYYLDGERVKIMPYEPRNPHHLRYVTEQAASPELLETVREYTITLCKSLGYDFNTVEFAVRDGIPYAIDFCNPAPDADIHSVGQENFDWVVENAANMAIERAQKQVDGADNLTWGTFINRAVIGKRPWVEETAVPAEATAISSPPPPAATDEVATEAMVAMYHQEPVEAKSTLLATIGTASEEDKDDLKKIKGVGPKLEGILNEIGIYTFAQVSKMTVNEYDLVDSLLSAFKGRGKRDDWAGQAAGFIAE